MKKLSKSIWEEAKKLEIASSHIYGIRSQWWCNIFHADWLPILQYQIDKNIVIYDGEIGAIVVLDRKGYIKKVLRRVVVLKTRRKNV